MGNTHTYRKYGWIPSLPDHRDLTCDYDITENVSIVDLRRKLGEVYDQGKLGSCVSNAVISAYDYDDINETGKVNTKLSRLFLYYNVRELNQCSDFDSGSSIKDNLRVFNHIGVCQEEKWPYNVYYSKFKPTNDCYNKTIGKSLIQYKKLKQDISQLKECLKSGHPFIFGFSIYESFETEDVVNTGIMRVPSDNEQVLGGHCALCVGYDDSNNHFIAMNSWGEHWGDKGFFYVPYLFMCNSDFVMEFWTISKINKYV